MDDSKQSTNSHEEDERFLSRPFRFKEEFVKEYQRFYHGKTEKAKDLYFLILTELQQAIAKGNTDKFKRFAGFIDYIGGIESPATLDKFHTDVNNPIKKANFVILACKHDKPKILNFVFTNSKVLFDLSRNVGKVSLSPVDTDEANHDAFYYAIRSGNTELLDTLITKWPGDYFASRPQELDEVLSKAYEELKFRNVSLSDEMGIFVENKLIGLRFFSSPLGLLPSVNDSLNFIRERVDLVLENIALLENEYSNEKKVDGRFLFVARCVVQNVNVLKRQLRSTYDRLPWEEIEFCLVTFVSSYVKKQEINLFYRTTVNKNKLLSYLKIFAKKLEICKSVIGSMSIGKLADLPKLKREEVVSKIVNDNPQFSDLYADYQKIRDIYSLEKISSYLNLALSIDAKEKEGQLIITRALQVIGEYLKNTLESPNLSATTSEFILLSLPKNTRKIIIDLRNSLSHVYSLSKRTEVEENANVDFFVGVQKDTRRIDGVITDILYNNKIKMMRFLLNELLHTKNLEEIKEIAEILKNVEVDEMKSPKSVTSEHVKIAKLIREWNASIPDQNKCEKDHFRQINDIIEFAEDKPENIRTDYRIAFGILQSLSVTLSENTLDPKYTLGSKIEAMNGFETTVPRIETYHLKKVLELSMTIFHSVRARVQADRRDEINRPFFEFLTFAQFGINTDDMKWIEKLREKICDGSFIPLSKQRKNLDMTDDEYDTQLTRKLSELKNIFQKNLSGGKLIENLPSHCQNKKLLTVVEMLVLDIMSILDRSEKYLENNMLFLDDNSPLLTGRCLRNHLAHGNTVLEVLLSDPSTAVILNAERLISENIVTSKKKVGKLVRDDPSKLKDKYDRRLIAIANQEKMFLALENGNLEELKATLMNGADINARSLNSWTSLHFAASSPSLAVVKFVLNSGFDTNVKDRNGRSPLHIAAAHGRMNIVEFFVEELALPVDIRDKRKRTPLHIAAKSGHKDVVEILLKNNADTNVLDSASCYSPLHYAVQQNHVDIFKILLEKEANVDTNEVTGGYTSLHLAAEYGCTEIVKILLDRGAKVDAKHDKEGTPLHAATIRGHLDIVNILIQHGANVNTVLLDGTTALIYAAQFNHEKITDVLLQHGANVNAVDKSEKKSALHHAAERGNEEIADMLLKKKANVNLVTVKGLTALHVAAKNGHSKVAACLLKRGSNIRARCKNNRTPLHLAAQAGHKEVVELLIKNRAEVNAKADDNSTPLYQAAEKGHSEVVDFLLKNKARADCRKVDGTTPIFIAALKGHKDVIDVLLKHKVDINVKTNDGWTPLHLAAQAGHRDVVVFLLQNKADLEAENKDRSTPLNTAVYGGHKEIVQLLLDSGAKVNATRTMGRYCSSTYVFSDGITSLHVAAELCNKEMVEILVANGANVNAKSDNTPTAFAPLHSAIQNKSKEIVEILVANGAIVDSMAITIAIDIGYKDIFDILLKKLARVDLKLKDGQTPLHGAAKRGHKEMVNALITKGADVNAACKRGITPLFFAAMKGYNEIVEILIANGANVDFKSIGGTPVHVAARQGYHTTVDILLRNGANINIGFEENGVNHTPLRTAVSVGHVSVVKTILEHRVVDLNAVGKGDEPLLFIAAQRGKLEMVKFLVEKGCDIRALNALTAMCIHMAANCGHIDVVEYLLTKGLDIHEEGTNYRTPLHYAALSNEPEMVKFLIAKGANVNAKDCYNQTPMHLAAYAGFYQNIRILLENGAIFDAEDSYRLRPLETFIKENYSDECFKTEDGVQSFFFFSATASLIHFVERNNYSEVVKNIKKGALIDAKFTEDETTSLHHAASKGYHRIVNVLLENKADPNSISKVGFTPLHYAAKFSHSNCIKALLSRGAMYNAVSKEGQVPLDFIKDKVIIDLFKLIDESFEKIKNGNVRVIEELKKLKDKETLKMVMNARNKENKTLMAAAATVDLSLFKRLKNVSQDDVSAQIHEATNLIVHGHCQQALDMLEKLYEKTKSNLGADNPVVLEIQSNIARALYKQGDYKKALDLYEEVFVKQKDLLGLDNKDTLDTRSSMALVMQKMSREEEALSIYEEVYPKQREILGPNHDDTLTTQGNMAGLLIHQKKYDEGLRIYKSIYEHLKETFGEIDPATISAQNNTAAALLQQGKTEAALKIFEKVLELKTVVLGSEHADTLRTMQNIAAVHSAEEKHHEALKIYQQVLDIQKKNFPPNYPETLNTQFCIGNVYFDQGKFTSALKAYKECIEQRKAVFGPDDPSVAIMLMKIKLISMKSQWEGRDPSEALQYLQKDINVASSEGDVRKVQRLLQDGADVNDKDIDGKSPLHYAVSSGHLDVVKILLENGADVTQTSNKGKTPLHTATSKGRREIVEVLLKHVSRDRLSGFVNAKIVSSGVTSLHVAAKNGFLEVAKCLLNHGAIYNIVNKEGKTPIDLAEDEEIIALLQLIEFLFEGAKKGDVGIVSKLKTLKPDDLLMATNARNNQNRGLLQVAIVNNRKNISSCVLELLKKYSK